MPESQPDKDHVVVGGVPVHKSIVRWAVILILSAVVGLGVDSFQRTKDAKLDLENASIDDIDLDDWTPKHVGLWLTREGFGQHSQTFQALSIDGDRLCELEAGNLEEAGVVDEREQLRMFDAIRRLRKEKVNDRNPTANGFWEYRSVNRHFVAVALPGIVMCPRTWMLVTFFLDNENIEHILNPDTRRTKADDPHNIAAWTDFLDPDDNSTDAAPTDAQGRPVAEPKMSDWKEQVRLSLLLAVLMYPHATAAIWLLGFVDTDPLLVIAIVLALVISQAQEFLDLYHALTFDKYVSDREKSRFRQSWLWGFLFMCFVWVATRSIPHTLMDAGFYAYVTAACLQGAVQLIRVGWRVWRNEAIFFQVATQRIVDEQTAKERIERQKTRQARLGPLMSGLSADISGTRSNSLAPRRSAADSRAPPTTAGDEGSVWGDLGDGVPTSRSAKAPIPSEVGQKDGSPAEEHDLFTGAAPARSHEFMPGWDDEEHDGFAPGQFPTTAPTLHAGESIFAGVKAARHDDEDDDDSEEDLAGVLSPEPKRGESIFAGLKAARHDDDDDDGSEEGLAGVLSPEPKRGESIFAGAKAAKQDDDDDDGSEGDLAGILDPNPRQRRSARIASKGSPGN